MALNRCYSSLRCTRDSRKLFYVDVDLPRERYQQFAVSPSLPPAFGRKDHGEVFYYIWTDENEIKIKIKIRKWVAFR